MRVKVCSASASLLDMFDDSWWVLYSSKRSVKALDCTLNLTMQPVEAENVRK